MIIDFTVTNFRSIKREQTFSLYVEGSPNNLRDNIAYPGGGKIGVLRTAGVYGANASGKSNLLLAFEALRYIVCASGDLKDGDLISCYEPYILSSSTKKAPISFEIEFFAADDIRFLYSVSFNNKRILNESLDFYPSRQKANLFNRKEHDGWENVSFGGHYKGGRKKFAFFDNNSYISKAGNNADSPKIIRSIFNYFRQDVMHLGAGQNIRSIGLEDYPKTVKNIARILSKIDTGIHGIEFRKDELPEEETSKINFPDHLPEQLKKKLVDFAGNEVIFLHKNDKDDDEIFSENMESEGTRKLFNILPLLIEVFRDGGVLLLDELDNSFHPHIAELIIKLFNDPKVNQNNSQLIFSTHNINLMSPSLLRRDQVWFTEKIDGETILSSLNDFDKSTVKSNSPFNKWYDEGRFGAIPNIDIDEIYKLLTERA